MKYEDKMEKLQDKMREKGERSYLSGSALIVHGKDKYYGIFGRVEYARLTTKRRDEEIARELSKNVSRKAIKEENNRVHKKTKGRVDFLPNSRDYFAYERVGIAFFLLFAPKCPISDKSSPSSCHFLVKVPLTLFSKY